MAAVPVRRLGKISLQITNMSGGDRLTSDIARSNTSTAKEHFQFSGRARACNYSFNQFRRFPYISDLRVKSVDYHKRNTGMVSGALITLSKTVIFPNSLNKSDA